MYIEEVIIEGFKSYATRTVISGWDPEFNAITGLNGTGKSNILDAICFVLGIDNLRQVRATSLQDLVYKRGQAGITKASVTVVFNNTSPEQSPIGYSDCPQVTVTRQIVLNGKNKYLINGHNAQQRAVENLFQSVQLNVNNPHFLIMQGQITRVLNMKPEEILAMIEESAGTRMFEDRKSKAIGTLDKKEKKVEEIAALINDTIEPKLNALRQERSEFLEFKRTEADLERFQRLLGAFDYTKAMTAKESHKDTLEELGKNLVLLNDQNIKSQDELKKVSSSIDNVISRKDKESQASGKVKELEESCKEMAATMVRLQTEISFKKEALKGEEATVKKTLQDLEAENGKILKLESTISKVEDKFSEAEGKRSKLQADLARDEDLLRSLETGLSGNDKTSETGYAKLLRESRDRFSQTKTTLYQLQMRAKSLRVEISKMESEVSKATKDTQLDTEKIEKLQSEISTLQMELSAENFEDSPTSSRSSLVEEQNQLKSTLASIQGELDNLNSTVESLKFRYTLKDPQFDHQKVKGVIAELIDLDESKLPYAAALEVAAGGRLYNVVVEDEMTATLLLDKGSLSRRVTIIPLNKIQPKKIPGEKVKLADRETKGQAKVALSLVGFQSEVNAAMEYVFGGTFVCESKEVASMVAFNRQLGHRAVTIQGDIYEPSGTLSGGAAPSFGSILEKLNTFRNLSNQAKEIQGNLEVINKKIVACENSRRNFMNREHELKAKQQELSTLARRFELNSAGRTLERYNSIKLELSQVEQEISLQERLAIEAENDCKLYEKESVELCDDREAKLASLSKQISMAKCKLSKDEPTFSKVSEEYSKLKNELAACKSYMSDLESRNLTSKETIDKLLASLTILNDEHIEAVTQHNGFRIKLELELKNLKKYDEELKILEAKKRALEDSLESFTLERRQLEHSITVTKKELERVEDFIRNLLSVHPWIKDSYQTFGVIGTPYDFSQYNMIEVVGKVKGLEGHRETLRKTINFNVMDMIDRVESKDNSLKQMLSTVKKDRSKIEETITKLNDYMLEALYKTWEKVNGYSKPSLIEIFFRDFGQIFGELLPGSSAKLDPLEGQEIMEGLEIKVNLGGVWKQSLAELSGGQRSLVALSLILALLQFKPAPMYILDEVDAALDLSHTENIGRLLKSRFKASQFIVVSLKEGMFANANVLFRTRFRDGVSGVERIVNDRAHGHDHGNSPSLTPAITTTIDNDVMGRGRARKGTTGIRLGKSNNGSNNNPIMAAATTTTTTNAR